MCDALVNRRLRECRKLLGLQDNGLHGKVTTWQVMRGDKRLYRLAQGAYFGAWNVI